MADFECDTQMLRDEGKKFIDFANDYNKSIDKFFDILTTLDINGVWNGKQYPKYRNRVTIEKRDYVKFGEGLRAIGDELVDYADSLTDVANRNEREYDNI